MAKGWLRVLLSTSAHGGGISVLLKTQRPNQVYVPSHPHWQNWEGCIFSTPRASDNTGSIHCYELFKEMVPNHQPRDASFSPSFLCPRFKSLISQHCEEPMFVGGGGAEFKKAVGLTLFTPTDWPVYGKFHVHYKRYSASTE